MVKEVNFILYIFKEYIYLKSKLRIFLKWIVGLMVGFLLECCWFIDFFKWMRVVLGEGRGEINVVVY